MCRLPDVSQLRQKFLRVRFLRERADLNEEVEDSRLGCPDSGGPLSSTQSLRIQRFGSHRLYWHFLELPSVGGHLQPRLRGLMLLHDLNAVDNYGNRGRRFADRLHIGNRDDVRRGRFTFAIADLHHRHFDIPAARLDQSDLLRCRV